jgi:hypothetical protein
MSEQKSKVPRQQGPEGASSVAGPFLQLQGLLELSPPSMRAISSHKFRH